MATWVPVSGKPRSFTSVQSATDSAPVALTDGFPLYGLTSFAATFACASGQNYATAVGQFNMYMLDVNIGLWSLVPGHEVVVPAAAVGLQSFSVLFGVDWARDAIAFIASGVNPTSGNLTLSFTPVGAPGVGVPM